MTIFVILMGFPFDAGRFWVCSQANEKDIFLSSNPASLASTGKGILRAGAGWQGGFVPGPLGGGFSLRNAATIWIEAGASFAYLRDTAHIVRDDTSDMDTITQKTNARFYALRVAVAQKKGVISYGFEALGALGRLSDDFSSATGTIFPDGITVSSSPFAYGGGAGVCLEMGLVSFGAHGRYWGDFLAGKRDFRGDSTNNLVLRETLIPDSLISGFPPELGLEILSQPLGLSGEFLYRGELGGLASYGRSFGPVFLRAACGYMGKPIFMGNALFGLGKLGLSLHGGYWGGMRAGGLVIYNLGD